MQILLQSLDIVQQPLDLGSGKVRRARQARFGTQSVRVAIGNLRRNVSGPRIVPHNGIVVRNARGSVPRRGGFPLIRHAHGRQWSRLPVQTVVFLQGSNDSLNAFDGIVPDFNGIMFVPTNLRAIKRGFRERRK